jgi:hypothetical protein
MATRNPQLSGIQTSVGPPAITDWTPVIQGGTQLGAALLDNRKTNILEGFRDEVSGIQETAIEAEKVELHAADQAFTTEFANRMNRINRIATQGAGQGARTRSLLEAETALRRAQRLRPSLAAELRQEAALVLGTDPTGTQIELMEQLAQQQSQSAQADWAEHVKHGYELGLPRDMTPGTADWYREYSVREQRFSANIQMVNEIAFAKNIDNLTESNRINAQIMIADPNGYFRATVTPLQKAMETFTHMSPDARLAWMGGQGEIDINGTLMTGPVFKAFMESAVTELDASMSGLSTEMQAQISSSVAAQKTRVTQTLAFLNDPKQDPSVIAAQFEMETNGFLSDLPSNERRVIFLATKLAPLVTALNGDDFAANNLVKKNQLLERLFSIAGFENLTSSQVLPTFQTMIASNARSITGSSSPEQRTQLAYEDYLDNVRELTGILATTEQNISPEVATNYVTQWIGAAKWLKETPNLNPVLTEEWLETIQDPATLAVLQKASPEIGEEYARELMDAFNTNAAKVSPMTDLYDEIFAFRPPAGDYRGALPISASDVLVPEIREDGTVVLQFAVGSALTPEMKLNYSAKMRTWGEALTRRVKARATLDQLLDNNTEPDYNRVYLNMAPDFPFTNYTVPGN